MEFFDTLEQSLNSRISAVPDSAGARRAAFDAAKAAGLPARRDEDWRYADLRPLKSGFTQTAVCKAAATDWISNVYAARLVLIDGILDTAQSDLKSLPDGVEITPDTNTGTAQARDSLAMLNTALMQGGIKLTVQQAIAAPVEILHINTGDAGGVHSKVTADVTAGAAVTLIERFIGTGWSNPTMQIDLHTGATLDHVRLVEEDDTALHTGRTSVSLHTDTQYRATNIATGGASSRYEVSTTILGAGADAVINGVALATAGQTHDMLTRTDHTVGTTTSDQIFRTIAEKRGTSSFQGKIIVAEDAQKTEADQSFKALLLDRTGEANAKPELEIFADDVKCSHGATVGELDRNALFYFMSRGIDPLTAQTMLVEAFAGDALVAVEDNDLRTTLMDRISVWMQQSGIKAGTV